MPFIQRHLSEFNKLKCDWRWYVIEGASSNTKDTAWCAKQEPRLSNDGTHEYLKSIATHPRVRFIARPFWGNKTVMVNAAVAEMSSDGVIMQIDADEFWGAPQLEAILEAFESDRSLGVAQFYCNYHVGPSIVITSNNTYGNRPTEWVRAWRLHRGAWFNSHEPPVYNNNKGKWLGRDETKRLGLVFDHYSWVLEDQVAYKEYFYRYRNAVKSWKLLQKNDKWPVKLKDFLYWVDDAAVANKVNLPIDPSIESELVKENT